MSDLSLYIDDFGTWDVIMGNTWPIHFKASNCMLEYLGKQPRMIKDKIVSACKDWPLIDLRNIDTIQNLFDNSRIYVDTPSASNTRAHYDLTGVKTTMNICDTVSMYNTSGIVHTGAAYDQYIPIFENTGSVKVAQSNWVRCSIIDHTEQFTNAYCKRNYEY